MRECGKCGESVAESKAFCPGCGAAMDEEATTAASDNFDGTMQFGQTMYDRLISDMGLDLGAKPVAEMGSTPPTDAAEKATEAARQPLPPLRQPAEQVVLKPAARPATAEVVLTPATASKEVAQMSPVPAAKSNLWKWLIAAAVVIVVLAVAIVIVAAAIIFFLMPRM